MKWSKSSTPDGIGLLVFSLFLVMNGRNISLKNWNDGVSPRAFPYFLAGCIFLLGTFLILSGVIKGKKEVSGSAAEQPGSFRDKRYCLFGKPSVIPPPLFMVFMVVAYQLFWKPIGFLIITPLFLWTALYALGTSPKRAVTIAVGVTAAVYTVFTYGFKVTLPSGLLHMIL